MSAMAFQLRSYLLVIEGCACGRQVGKCNDGQFDGTAVEVRDEGDGDGVSFVLFSL